MTEQHDKGPLSMDYASRMARAKEMGFDTDTVYYHGTSRVGGEGIKAFDSTKWKDVAGYFSKDPGFASVSAEFGPNPTVYPVYIKKGRTLDLSSLGDSEGITHDQIIKKLTNSGVKFNESVIRSVPQHEITGGQPVWSYLAKNDLIKDIKGSGFDGISFKEMGSVDVQHLLDTGQEIAKATSNYISLNPVNIRSVNAVFDPRYLNSPKLMGDGPAIVGPELEDHQSHQPQNDDFSLGM
ncbi:hypothetical protein N9V62_03925 [Porticoccaceae bacterium]|nr:hypothetical protein [Porticoccaceae bacterium]